MIMSVQEKKIEQEALSSSVSYRAYLADKLLSSLDSPGQSEIDEAWANEVEDRIAAFERDEIKAVNEDEAFAELEKRFQ